MTSKRISLAHPGIGQVPLGLKYVKSRRFDFRLVTDLALLLTLFQVFSHILRNDSREEAEKKVQNDPSLADDNAIIEDVVPARFVHIDQSEYGAVEVLQDNIHPPELAEKLKKVRSIRIR